MSKLSNDKQIQEIALNKINIFNSEEARWLWKTYTLIQRDLYFTLGYFPNKLLVQWSVL